MYLSWQHPRLSSVLLGGILFQVCLILPSGDTRISGKLEIFFGSLITSFRVASGKKRSTLDHLVRSETFIQEGFIKKEHVVSVFFDLQKAYDTTWRYGILRDLHELGLRGRLPTLLRTSLEVEVFTSGWAQPYLTCSTKNRVCPREALYLSPFLS